MTEASKTFENDLNPRKRISRIGIVTKINSELKLHKPVIEGLGNLTQIPKTEKLIIATTHLSDIDIETAIAAIAPYRDVSVTSQSTHLENPISGRIMRWAAKKEIYGISSRPRKNSTWRQDFEFNPQNYEAMRTPLEKGRALVIAAHQPTHEWKLPNKPGLGAIYLAQISGATILPTAVDIQYPEFIDLPPISLDILKRLLQGKRLDVKVAFGKPIRPTPIPSEEIKLLNKFLNHDEKHTLTKDEISKSRSILEKLKLQGSEIMKSLASMLPQYKRGPWEKSSEI